MFRLQLTAHAKKTDYLQVMQNEAGCIFYSIVVVQ